MNGMRLLRTLAISREEGNPSPTINKFLVLCKLISYALVVSDHTTSFTLSGTPSSQNLKNPNSVPAQPRWSTPHACKSPPVMSTNPLTPWMCHTGLKCGFVTAQGVEQPARGAKQVSLKPIRYEMQQCRVLTTCGLLKCIDLECNYMHAKWPPGHSARPACCRHQTSDHRRVVQGTLRLWSPRPHQAQGFKCPSTHHHEHPTPPPPTPQPSYLQLQRL
jgi:hypothetical protein